GGSPGKVAGRVCGLVDEAGVADVAGRGDVDAVLLLLAGAVADDPLAVGRPVERDESGQGEGLLRFGGVAVQGPGAGGLPAVPAVDGADEQPGAVGGPLGVEDPAVQGD